jgi:hypothetical protein
MFGWFRKKPQKTRKELFKDLTVAASRERLAKHQCDLLESAEASKKEKQEARKNWFAAQEAVVEAANNLSASLLR